MYLAGDCIIIETNYYEDGSAKAHLFVVILDAKLDDDITILIPMDSIPDRGWYDRTTVIEIGDHDFVKKPTYMNYNEGIYRSKSWIDSNGRKREPPVSSKLLKKISSGIKNSEHVPNDVYEFLDSSIKCNIT